ncbi:MAG TPA: NAD(P)H-dependent oxidoreductase [Steroidobacteraceae bacterium]
MNILHIDSSIQGAASASRVLTREIVAQLKAAQPRATVTYRNLAAGALHHLRALPQTDAADAARDAATLDEFLAADVIVIGAPIYNFSIPSQLKAWIDRIAVAGKSFRYTESGPQGLVQGKKVIVALAHGAVHTPGATPEFGESYLQFLFGFLGIEDVTFVRAQGLSLSPRQRTAALEAAVSAIRVPVQLAA